MFTFTLSSRLFPKVYTRAHGNCRVDGPLRNENGGFLLNLIVSIVELTVIVVYGNATAFAPPWLPATYKVIIAIRCYDFRGERIPRVTGFRAAWHSYIPLPSWERVRGTSIYQINFTILPLKPFHLSFVSFRYTWYVYMWLKFPFILIIIRNSRDADK